MKINKNKSYIQIKRVDFKLQLDSDERLDKIIEMLMSDNKTIELEMYAKTG